MNPRPHGIDNVENDADSADENGGMPSSEEFDRFYTECHDEGEA